MTLPDGKAVGRATIRMSCRKPCRQRSRESARDVLLAEEHVLPWQIFPQTTMAIHLTTIVERSRPTRGPNSSETVCNIVQGFHHAKEYKLGCDLRLRFSLQCTDRPTLVNAGNMP